SETDDGRTSTWSSRQSRTSVSPTGRPVERIWISGWTALGGTISRSYSYPLPSFAAPNHWFFPLGYVHVFPSVCAQVWPAVTTRALAVERRVASPGCTKCT